MQWGPFSPELTMIATTCLLPFRLDRLLSVPGIDENDAKVFEVTDVACDSFNLSDPAIEGNALPFAGVRHLFGIDIGHEADAR